MRALVLLLGLCAAVFERGACRHDGGHTKRKHGHHHHDEKNEPQHGRREKGRHKKHEKRSRNNETFRDSEGGPTKLIPEESNEASSSTKLFEGDIVPTENQIRLFYGKKAVKRLRGEGILPARVEDERERAREKERHNGRRDRGGVTLGHRHGWGVRVDYRWTDRGGPNDLVQIPYTIQKGNYTAEQEKKIVDAIEDLATSSGVIEFVPRVAEKNYVLVVNEPGCSSYVGNVKLGAQKLTLHDTGCLYSEGVIHHEFLHAVGFFHEQSRPDRDEHVKINFENVRDNAKTNFLKEKDDESLGTPYDYGSVMHYNKKEFSKNGEDTITPLDDPNGANIGQRDGASDSDITLVRLLYQCVSGPRRLDAYQKDLCTEDCKCWEGAVGCVGDNTCQGKMTCENKTCVNKANDDKAPQASV